MECNWKCQYFNGLICTDDKRWINKDGDEVCRYQEGAICQEQLDDKVSLSHLLVVMSSRFDEEIEKVMSMVEWSDQRDRKMVLDLFKKMQSAILHQKISET